MARFFAITPHLAFIQETHRLVLSWTRFAGTDVKAYTVTLTKDDIASLRDALGGETGHWSSQDGLLDLMATTHESVLTFRLPESAACDELTLAGEELTRFKEGVTALLR